MIVPSYTDEMILKELMDDWPSVKRQAKKLSQALLKAMPKGRIGQDADLMRRKAGRFRSKNGNTWIVSVACAHGSTQWYSVCYAEVENGYGTKSIFYLRGMNTRRPYYVELIPHAIRRIRERYQSGQALVFAESDIYKLCMMAVFDRHECGIFLAAGKVGRDGHFNGFTDKDGNTPGVVLNKNSMFYARRTPSGNFIFKTFIQPVAEEGSRKKEFYNMMFGIYFLMNRERTKYKDKSFEDMFNALWKIYPTMHRHLECLHERLVPLFP